MALCLPGVIYLILWVLGQSSRVVRGEIALLALAALGVLPTGVALVVSGLSEQFSLPGWRRIRWLPLLAIAGTFLWWQSIT